MQRAVVGNVALHARHAPHFLAIVAVNHRQLQWTVALHLHGDVAVELQGCRQQAGGDQQFTQQLLYRRRVVVIVQNLLIGFADGNQLTAHRVVFKQVTVQLVMVGHSFLSLRRGVIPAHQI